MFGYIIKTHHLYYVRWLTNHNVICLTRPIKLFIVNKVVAINYCTLSVNFFYCTLPLSIRSPRMSTPCHSSYLKSVQMVNTFFFFINKTIYEPRHHR